LSLAESKETRPDRWEHAKLDDLLNGSTRIEFTLRFTLSHPGLSTTIVGTRNLEHLRDNIRAAKKGPLPADVLTEAKRRLAKAGSAPQPTNAPVKSSTSAAQHASAGK
jgi:aryl-alcohol dehydrogenase-like predicted oxidoreductase